MSAERNDGGPAFPAGSFSAQHAPGMTLRDWFAGEVMYLSHYEVCSEETGTYLDAAKRAYEFADAMLIARASKATS
jgi:hypothetical protein